MIIRVIVAGSFVAITTAPAYYWRSKKFDAHVLAHAANGDTSFSEWEYNVEIAGMGPMRVVQVAVRRWKDGKVVRERFYHK